MPHLANLAEKSKPQWGLLKCDIFPDESLNDAEDVSHLGHFFVQNRDGLRERAANGSVSGVDKANILAFFISMHCRTCSVF